MEICLAEHINLFESEWYDLEKVHTLENYNGYKEK